MLNLKNQRFGRLTANEPETRYKRGWHCTCDCGNRVWVITESLVNGNTTSCGCSRREDLTGRAFGKISVVGPSHRDEKNRRYIWKCLCECGKTKMVETKNLLRGATTHCGCSKAPAKNRLTELQRQINKKLSYYEANAKSKGREFSLSKEDVGLLFTSDCFYCGKVAVLNDLNGIDRANNSVGYTKDNSLPCCAKCNYIKNKYDKDDFLLWANMVAKRNPVLPT